ncbi:hypothetical protein [Macrococcoides canis]|uniref:hypothetical protein n=1 Tax=Macrococcoides canis TaxID=1855823 RepID=UPI0020B869EF|nr:hypothetical protein [Macrococcus canis]UTH10926.1 hypothetical protein KFV10_08390 [Macrococcus canis]
MEFIIRRASTWVLENKPIDNCEWKDVVYKHIRTTKSFEEFDRKFSDNEGKWLDKGWDHHINSDSHIQRNEYKKAWVKEFKTFDELIKFIDDEGSVIIEKDNYELPEIIIYDDWIE